MPTLQRRLFRLRAALPALLFLALPVSLPGARAGELVYPPDVFHPHDFVDVTKPPYGVDNTGKEDATEKLRQAITDIYNEGIPALRIKTLYFPNGTYRITDTLDCVAVKKDGKIGIAHRLCWVGQSRDGTILKLDDKLPAFQDPAKPKGIVRTESIGTNGNDAYDNNLWNLTFDVGAGNPGAAGIDFLGNNNCSIRDILVKAGPDSGRAGILMTRTWPGPAFVKNLEVDGCDYGVFLSRMEYSITFEHLVMRGQRKAAFRNENNAAFIRDLQSDNAVPAIENANAGGLVVLVDSRLKGGQPSGAAITNASGLFVRNVTTEGYGEGVRTTGKDPLPGAAAGLIAEYTSHPPLVNKGFPSSRTTSLNLEVRETPEYVDNDFANWYSVGTKATPSAGDKDQTSAIQAAIDEAAAQGKTTLYFPPGQYIVSSPLEIHGGFRRLLGLGSVIRAKGGAAFSDAAHQQPVFHLHDLTGDSLEINEFLVAADTDRPLGFRGIQHDSSKTLVIKDFEVNGLGIKGPLPAYQGSADAGDVYIEGGVANRWIFNRPGQHVWARQMDPEGDVSPKITNSGAKLWILGLKTERPGTHVESLKGAETEVLGGLFYPVVKPTDEPMFRVEDSRFSVSYVTIDNNYSPDCPNHLLETRNGMALSLHKEDAYPRACFGGAVAALVPLMVAAPADAAP